MSEKQIKNAYINNDLSPKKIDLIKRNTKPKQSKISFDQAVKEAKEQKQPFKNKSQLHSSLPSHSQHQINPQKKMQTNDKIERLFYTESYRQKMEARLSEIQQRKKQLNARSLEKQMKARLLRKIHQNIELKQKMDILKDIQQRRQLLLTQKNQRDKKRKQQLKLLHQSNLVNSEMFRKSKIKIMKKQLNDSRYKQQQSLKNMKFKNYLQQKQKQSRLIFLNSRHEFLIKSNSQRNLNRQFLSTNNSNRKSIKSISRGIKTSSYNRKNNKEQQIQDEQLIIQQYTSNSNKKQNITDEKTTKSRQIQRKYNQTVRKTESQNNECTDPQQLSNRRKADEDGNEHEDGEQNQRDGINDNNN